jgi:hypothetical protein
MKHLIVAVMLMVMITPALGADSSGAFATRGAGAKTCGWWTAKRAGIDPEKYMASSWVLGFLAGSNYFATGIYDVSKGVDNEGLLAWVDNYCAVNPLDSVADAAMELVAFLILRDE